MLVVEFLHWLSTCIDQMQWEHNCQNYSFSHGSPAQDRKPVCFNPAEHSGTIRLNLSFPILSFQWGTASSSTGSRGTTWASTSASPRTGSRPRSAGESAFKSLVSHSDNWYIVCNFHLAWSIVRNIQIGKYKLYVVVTFRSASCRAQKISQWRDAIHFHRCVRITVSSKSLP